MAYKSSRVCGLISREHFSDEHLDILKNINNETRIQCESSSEIKRKITLALLETAIMAEMSQRAGMTVPNIIDFVLKTSDVQISPGTIYPTLYLMEKKGKIIKLPNRRKKTYVLTEMGKKEIASLQNGAKYLQAFMLKLISRQNSNLREVNLEQIVKSPSITV